MAFFTVIKRNESLCVFMAQINNAELREAQFGEQTARLMTKISSVFTHPMIFGLF